MTSHAIMLPESPSLHPFWPLRFPFMLFPLSKLLPCFFNVGGNVFTITSMMFIVLAISYPFRAFNMSMIIGVCRAGGDTIFSIFLRYIRHVAGHTASRGRGVFRLPRACLGDLCMPVHGRPA